MAAFVEVTMYKAPSVEQGSLDQKGVCVETPTTRDWCPQREHREELKEM